MNELELKEGDSAYAPSSATSVQRTWKRLGWIPPSKDPLILAKWNYYQSLSIRSAATLEIK